MVTLLLRQSGAALRVLLVATVVLGLVYPLALWGVSRLPGLNGPAEGSVLAGSSGSSLIGIDPVPADPAADPYFHTRPSASAEDVLGPGEPSSSGGANHRGFSDKMLGQGEPSTPGGSNQSGFSDKLPGQVQQRRAAIAAREGVAPRAVPADAVTA